MKNNATPNFGLCEGDIVLLNGKRFKVSSANASSFSYEPLTFMDYFVMICKRIKKFFKTIWNNIIY